LKIKHFFISFFITIISFGCSTPESSFSAEELKMIDSLYQVEIDTLKVTFDLLCDSIHKNDYPILIDSLKVLRQKEILDIINK